MDGAGSQEVKTPKNYLLCFITNYNKGVDLLYKMCCAIKRFPSPHGGQMCSGKYILSKRNATNTYIYLDINIHTVVAYGL